MVCVSLCVLWVSVISGNSVSYYCKEMDIGCWVGVVCMFIMLFLYGKNMQICCVD